MALVLKMQIGCKHELEMNNLDFQEIESYC